MALVFDRLIGEDFYLGTGTTTVIAPGGGSVVGTQISLTTFSTHGPSGVADTATYAPPSLNSLATALTTITVNGAVLGDLALASFSLDLQGLVMTAYVSSQNTVTVVLFNPTASTIALSSGTLKALVFHVN